MTFNSFAAAAGAAGNPDFLEEAVGVDTGGGTLVTAGTAAHTLAAAYTQLAGGGAAGVTLNDWFGFELLVGVTSSSGARLRINLSIDGGLTDLLTGVYSQPSSGGGFARLPFPLQVPAGSDIRVKVAGATTGSITSRQMIRGFRKTLYTPPGFTIAENLVAGQPDATNTRPSTTAVPLTTSAASWTQLVAALGQSYGAFLVMMSDNGTAPTVTQGAKATLAKGAAAAEVAIGGNGFTLATASPTVSKAGALINAAVAAGQRLSINLQAAAAGTPDQIDVGIIGFR